MKKCILSLFVVLLLTGCASIVTGQNQSLSIDTEPTGANCTLTNDKGTWYVNSTPGTVTVLRSYESLNYTCKKGSRSCSGSTKSTTKGMAFGNVLAGGIIGAAVDMGTGAAYDYPTPIACQMK